jgi:hypothetical protein
MRVTREDFDTVGFFLVQVAFACVTYPQKASAQQCKSSEIKFIFSKHMFQV